MPFHFTYSDWEAAGSFVVSQLDIHWIEKIQPRSQSAVLSISASRSDLKLCLKAFFFSPNGWKGSFQGRFQTNVRFKEQKWFVVSVQSDGKLRDFFVWFFYPKDHQEVAFLDCLRGCVELKSVCVCACFQAWPRADNEAWTRRLELIKEVGGRMEVRWRAVDHQRTCVRAAFRRCWVWKGAIHQDINKTAHSRLLLCLRTPHPLS